MAQENRSFDHYFGHLPDYWRASGYPMQPFDAYPLHASNPSFEGSTLVLGFHLVTECVENPSPSWNESHRDFNRDPTSTTPTLDGFVYTAAEDAQVGGLHDTPGIRAMGYYTGSDIPYYYFMASNFGTSDRWFSPVMSATDANRAYLMSGTSAGHVYPLKFSDSGPLLNKTIFQLLDDHGVSWKIYVSDYLNGNPQTYLSMFSYWQQPQVQAKVVPVSQFFTDISHNTLPQVALIETAHLTGRDEHPTIPGVPGGGVQVGSNYVSSLVNALMSSKSWKDSVFILTHDEFGGFYDHVPPEPSVSPDGIAPLDLVPGDICSPGNGQGSRTCDFVYTGYRVPLIVVSPFSKKNYVSHTPADYTAILKLIETRFKLPSLTKRDAAQIDMTEFFDFINVPWKIPPVPPAQPTNGPCYLDHLP